MFFCISLLLSLILGDLIMKRLILVLLSLFSLPVMGTHIVGGEFEFLFRGVDPANGQFRYHLSLILYFDRINGSEGARDEEILIRIFRKRDNAVMHDNILLLYSDARDVGYYKPECSSGNSIQTDRIYYTYMIGNTQAEYRLDPDDFDDPQGYYIAWERCCRNYGITNVYSEDPNTGSTRYAGQTFYLEFPPLRKNGKDFYNSSPSLFPPLSDYACPGRFYWVKFNGTDPDGDELVYSMVTPMNTITGDAVPPTGLPRPAPYPTILWRPGFGANNIMKGSPDIKIDEKGLLTVTPTVAGLYVFAVKCEEFRDGKKIGEIRRDFQMLVLTNCPPATKPVIKARRKGAATYAEGQLSVPFSNSVTDDQRCIEILVTDPDAATRQEKIKILAVAANFDENVDGVLPDISTSILDNSNSEASFEVCFPQCPYTGGTFKIDIIVEDDACPLPLTDTITVEVDIELPPNESPVFDKELITATFDEGSGTPMWTFVGTDGDGDLVQILPPAEDELNLTDYGFNLEVTNEQPGQVNAQLSWNTKCDEVDFSKKTDFQFKILLDDQDKCEVTPADTLTFDLAINLYDFHSPVISYLPDPASQEIVLTKKMFENISFDVEGVDEDGDQLTLKGRGIGFDMATYNASFPEKTFIGQGTSQFTWFPDCDHINLNTKDEFKFELEVIDQHNRCNYYLSDILFVTVNVLPPDNHEPTLTVNDQSGDHDLAYTLGEEILIPALGVDADANPQDLLTMELIKAEGSVEPEGFVFSSTPQKGVVDGTLEWKPGCEIFHNGVYENDYTFTFRVFDDRCFTAVGADTVTVNLKVKDVQSQVEDFMPPNIITPNGDGKNDFFAMLKEDEDTKELIDILPKDNCAGIFKRISIYNRWGRAVFESTSRDFRWYPKDDPTGIYFYQLLYSNVEYKGIITLAGESQNNR